MPDTHDERSGDGYVARANRQVDKCRERGRASAADVEALRNDVEELAEQLAAATARAEKAEAYARSLTGAVRMAADFSDAMKRVRELPATDLGGVAAANAAFIAAAADRIAAQAADAAQGGLSATAEERLDFGGRIDACMELRIRPALTEGLQDTQLRGESGTRRISEWADWIATVLAECLGADDPGAGSGTPPPQGKLARPTTATERVPCAFCGELMTRSLVRSSKKYCSTSCRQRAFDNGDSRTNGLTSRARVGGFVVVEDVDPDVVFERDRGICYLCDQPVDRNAGVTAEGATIDHVIPTSKGGVHSYANVKLTHRRCNSRKNNRIVDIIGFELRDQSGVAPDNDATEGR